jgi:hypothetical protein
MKNLNRDRHVVAFAPVTETAQASTKPTEEKKEERGKDK